MNSSIGHWLFSTLAARQSKALRKPRAGESGYQPVLGTFDPNSGAVPDLVVNAAAFTARYNLAAPFNELAGSPIGEGAVPAINELQARVRKADNPCFLDNNGNYVVTDVDVLDLRYVARSGDPIWNSVRDLFSASGGD